MAGKTKAQIEAENLEAGAAKDALTAPTHETDHGGAMVVEVQVEEIKPDATSDFTMEIITTAPGTFGAGGIEEVGKQATINCAAFSFAWMKPNGKASVERLKAYRASLKKDATA
jgi:hypothetical protein